MKIILIILGVSAVFYLYNLSGIKLTVFEASSIAAGLIGVYWMAYFLNYKRKQRKNVDNG